MLSQASRARFHTLADAVTLQAADERAAIIYLETERRPRRVSRAAFRQTVLSHAAGLGQLGIGPGDLVVIAHTQNLESIYAFWGAMLAGAIPAMFPTLTEKLDAAVYMGGMAELARLSGVKAILTTDAFAGELAGRVPCPVYGSAGLAAAVAALRGDRGQGTGDVYGSAGLAAAGAVAFLQHSSGTTGLQKGVALSHEAVLNQLASYSEAIGLNAADVIVSWLPLYHDMGLIAGFLLPLFQGVPLVLMSPFDWVRHPAMLFKAIHDYRGTLCWLPNFAYNHCARRIRQRDSAGLSAATMRLFVNCSEPVYHQSHELFLERFRANGVRPEMLGVSYAMAENTFAVTQTAPGRAARLDVVDRQGLEEERAARPVTADHPRAITRVSCGPPIAGTAVRVVDDERRPLAERQVGELAVQSDCLFDGYFRRPELEPFHDGWYLTGDMGYVADGEVYVAGRSKDLIINAGKNIYPQDIEAAANTVAGLYPGRVVAFGVADEREGTELVAVVAEVREGDEAVRRSIARAIREAVARQTMVTVSYVHLVGPRWLIKTSSGKIARRANRQKWLAERAAQSLPA